MRLGDLINVDEAWYDPRTWGKQARQDAAGSKIGAGYTAAVPKLDVQNAAASKIGAGYAAAAAPKPARQGGGAKPAATAPAAPAVDADLEQRKEVARLFGPDKSAPAAQTTAPLAASQVSAAKPPAATTPTAAPEADPTKDTYSAAADPSLQAGYKEIAAAPPPPDVEAMKTGIAAGSPAAQAAAPTQTAAAPAPAPAAEPAKTTAAPVIPGINASATTPVPAGAAKPTPVKTQTPAGQIMAEEITMKKLLNIFTEAPTRTAPADTGPSSGLAGDKSMNPDSMLAKSLPPNYYDPVRNRKDWKDEENFKMPKDPYTGKRGYDKDSPAGYGRYGKNTADLQKYINSLGYKDEKGNPLQLDARMGPKTGAAVDALRSKLDPNSAEYKTLRSFDAAAGFDKDARISGPMKKTKPADKTSDADPTKDPYNPSADTTLDPGRKETGKTSSNEPMSYPDTATFGGKAYSDNVPLSKSASMAQAYNDPLMIPQPDAKPTEVGTSSSGAAMPSDKVPDNVGPVVRTGTGGVLTTSDGTPVRSRSADEIEWQMKNPMQTYPGAEAVAKQKEQGEKNLQSIKNFLGFGDKTPAPTAGGSAKPTEKSPEVTMEESLSDILRLSGLQLNEKAASKQQQKFMGMVHAMQKGEKVKGASSELKKAATGMSKKAAHDFAATKHKGLPQKVNESVMLEAGSALEHIIDKFRHETKSFVNGNELDSDLYDALYDYYLSNGDMPYGVAKARTGDPFQWISSKFENELDIMGYQRMSSGPDNSLSELARLAGLHEGKIDECGDMGSDMSQPDSFNVSTNVSSDGTKSINVSAQGGKADELMQMLKMAGMRPHDDHNHEEPEIVLVSGDDMMEEPELEEERITQYSNTPEEEYETIASITHQGNDLNREKQQYSMDRGRDNPMAIDLEESLAEMLESIKVKEGGDPYAGIEAERPYKDPKTGKMITPPRGATMPPPDNEFPAGDKRNLTPPVAKGKK